MSAQSLAAWWGLISGARWFGGKGRSASLTAVTPLPWLTPAGSLPRVRGEIATISYAEGRTEQYLLLAGYTANPEAPVVTTVADPEHGTLSVVEAPGDPGCVRALLTALVDPAHPAMQWVDASAIDPSEPTTIWPGEQSNTTLCLGDHHMLKLFRRLEAGRNLDVEVLAALNGSGITPALYGTLVGDLPAGARADLGMFVERVQGVEDGWVWACQACAADRDISVEAMQLGAALRAVHERLASAFGTSVEPGAEVADQIRLRFDAARAEIDELALIDGAVESTLQALARTDLVTQRVHGDFHLGQTLRSANGWTIIDFEGEPLKSLSERRRPDSVWRDVAGMLRSFDYVRAAHPDPTSAPAAAWSAAARHAFLDGYCQGASPDSGVLDAYELDKAVYEVVYETRNRPDWAHIPLGAVHNVARRTAPSPTHDSPSRTHNSKEN